MKDYDIKYIFIRHGKLDLPYKSHSEMPLSVLAEIASGRMNPSIDINFLNERLLKLEPFLKNVDKIVTSSFKRCIETGQSIADFLEQKKKINYIAEDDLKEVFFDIEKIVQDLDHIPNLPELNSLVFQAICGLREGSESSQSVINRVNGTLKKYGTDDKVVLIVTHSFLLEIMEMYINNKHIQNFNGSYEELLKSPKISYLSGFTTDKNLNIIDFIGI